MSGIKLVDENSLVIAETDSGIATRLEKDLVFAFEHLESGFKNSQNKSLRDLNLDDFPLELSASGPASIPIGQEAWTISGGAKASVNVLTGDHARDFLRNVRPASPVTPDLVSFAFSTNLATGPVINAGDVCFGLTVGSQVTIANYATAADSTQFLAAVQKAISGLTIPHELDDLIAMPAGDICSIEGKGVLKFTVSFEYSVLNNVLASEPLDFVSQSLNVTAESGPTVSVTVEHSSTHRLTIAALGENKYQLGACLAAEAEIEEGLDFAIGVSAGAGSFDALTFVVEQITPGASREMAKIRQSLSAGEQSNLSDQIKSVLQGAMKSGIQASLHDALTKSKETNRLFTYEVDLGSLDDSGKKAVQAALRGDFTQLTNPGLRLAGIRDIDTITTTTLGAKHELTIHLLGILNFSDVSSFVQRAKTGLNPQTGEVVLTSTDIKVVENNVEPDRLREALLRSAMITTAAASSPQSPDFTYRMVFFDRKARPSPSDLRQFANVLQAVGSQDRPNLEQTGAAAIYLSLNLNKELSLGLFRSRTVDDFIRAGQRALKTILNGDDLAARRLRLADIDAVFWKEVSAQGSRDNVLRLLATKGISDSASSTDFFSIDWWAQAMGKISGAIAGQKPLREAEKDALKLSQGGFDMPWALLATYYLLAPQAQVDAKFTRAGATIAAGAAGL
ncbi:MAG TPA: hypothetical protein VHZ07_23980 [Bryobacteraceae bacterium]|jgi:hypothetical protein|nr:hypothetical protein [Bryobacteraceae bacterium]